MSLRPILEWIADRVGPPRVIYDRAGKSPYLSRYYLFGGPTMADGSWPFERDGAMRAGALWPTRAFGLYLHKFHRGDDDMQLHNHPWRAAVSIILAGGYREERRVGDRVVARSVWPGSVNVILADDFHRVDLFERDAWSLFLAGPKFQGWGFWDRENGSFVPWREFITARRDPVSFARAESWRR